jgi:DNA-binding NarL/FixJ family response regulator
MEKKEDKDERPKIAIIDSNTLAVIGLRHILQDIMPMMAIDTFESMNDFGSSDVDNYYHYFVTMDVVLNKRQFFIDHRHKTIVLTTSLDNGNLLSDFHCLSINVPEDKLVHSFLKLEQYAHAKGKNLPKIMNESQPKLLSDREIEVLSLITQGYINKEIADLLHIGVTTVITHRKNIMDKLGMKSVSALTIYAVMHGYVDIEKLKR